jgi:DNA polymerase-1
MHGIDFETQAIGDRPHGYPPEPVGVALSGPGRYLHWGHHDSKPAQIELMPALAAMREMFLEPCCFHNAAFDLAVAGERLGLKPPRVIHDTMFLAFLLDPYGDISLKPLATRYLQQPPTERDAVHAWLLERKLIRKGLKRWGGFISKAPGAIVGPYAIGDVQRTLDLFKFLYPRVVDAGMQRAYIRECSLLPMLLDNSRQGVPLDRKRLAADTSDYEKILTGVDRTLHRALGQINIDSGEELADALERIYRVELPKTPTGKRSTAKQALLDALPNVPVKGWLLYRSALEKTLSTYMRPWLEHGTALHCNWNQIKTDEAGARTGRLSSSPNLQNITSPETYATLAAAMKLCGIKGKWLLPNLRSYIVAPKGWRLFSLDYSQQELRMLAHFEDGVLAKAYRDDPALDLHKFVAGLAKIERRHAKTINFAKIYGAGRAKLAQQLGLPQAESDAIVNAYENALPSVKGLQREVQTIARNGEFVTTLGGRRYFSPPAEIVDGRLRDFNYKTLNYLIQGSSADQTKEAMVCWHGDIAGRSDVRFLLSEHDELVGMAPVKTVKREAAKLQHMMVEAFTLDVPVHVDIKYGLNYGEMK